MARIAKLVTALAAALLLGASQARAAEVDVALVVAIDVSASVTPDRFELQRRGIADTIASPEFIEAVSRGPRHAVALTVFEWSGVRESEVVVPWTTVQSAEDAASVSKRLAAAPRRLSGSTAVGEAIWIALDLLDRAPPAERQVIDVSGDGRANAGRATWEARDEAVRRGAIVNGLPILDVEIGVEDWYRDNVQGGPRSFTMPARTLGDFTRALLAKLIREIS